ncbi:MAG: outer membrane protein assembly factor BamA [Nitrospirae bacterium]|nr:outer membrane protein assembly factor BamA [Nitrospirota bacterium]
MNERRTTASAIRRMLALVAVVWLIVTFLPACPASAAEPQNYLGRPVSVVAVQGLTGMDEDYFLELFGLHPGMKITMERVRRGISRVFRKGIFTDVRVEALDPDEGGVPILVVVTEKTRIAGVTVNGNFALPNKEIMKLSGYRRGAEFHADRRSDVERRIEKAYDEYGFPDARVAIKAEAAAGSGVVDVEILIAEGEPRLVQRIELEGNGDRERVAMHIPFAAGDRFNSAALGAALDGLYADMKLDGHYAARKPDWSFRDGTLRVVFDDGPLFRVRFDGIEAVNEHELLSEYRMDEAVEPFSDETIEEAALRYVSLYHKRGYPFAQAAATVEEERDERVVVFFIYEGPRIILRRIEFTGATLPEEKIREAFDYPEGDPYSEARLGAGIARIISLYNALGWLKAEAMVSTRNLDFKPGEASVTVTIGEGPRTTIRSVALEGVTAFDESEIHDTLGLEIGRTYNETDVSDARMRLIEKFGSAGFVDASVNLQRNFSDDMRKVDIVFQVSEGRQFRFGKTIVAGNHRTLDGIIQREFGVSEGEYFDYRKVLEGKRALHKMRIFSSVDIETAREGASPNSQDMVVRVTEAPFGSVDFGVGYGDYDLARGFVEIGHRNLGGLNRRLSLRGEASAVERRWILRYEDPWLLTSYKLPFRAALIRENMRKLDADTREIRYESDRSAFIAGIDRDFSETVKGSLEYEYSFVDTFNVRPGEILSRDDVGTLGISSLSPSLARDTRSNPFNPRHGSLNAAVVKIASKALMSETEFIKLTGQSSWYFHLARPLVAALSFKGGFAHGMGRDKELPIVERFFLGGGSSVRGYARDTLGPKADDGTPTGGNVYALGNAELRVDVWKGLGLVGFVDGGNVWQKTEDVNPVGFKYTYGGGIRYNTPVGPFRLDYGQKFAPEPGESRFEIHFSLGHAF